MGLYRLIYASTATDIDRDLLTNIIETSNRLNSKNYITGMMIFDNGYFLQLLEGERAFLTKRFLEISKDTHHNDIEILTCGPIHARLFTGWGARYLGSQGASSKILKRYQGGPEFNPYKFTSSNVEYLCLDMSTFAVSANDVANKLSIAQ
ncbi:BLUF domain-containing protein [Tropicibacter sp. R15_0]|uniref:BLUF domain-containing protein n=1 Tax=Tropicibacter sp. R15_0 TaxID=2821101 RepID=UPI001ADC92C7|nr:BLUF domain-containing protein [Tropicibacter sp. R15_0]MBO9465313.1 BLUF domain-containing protein [Tropicibacter sp. R15_0]